MVQFDGGWGETQKTSRWLLHASETIGVVSDVRGCEHVCLANGRSVLLLYA